MRVIGADEFEVREFITGSLVGSYNGVEEIVFTSTTFTATAQPASVLGTRSRR